MLKVTEIKCKQALNKVNNPDLPHQWDLNLYRGCQHGCKYCWAIYSHDYLEGNFYEDIYVKTNIVTQLEKQLAAPNWQRETIGIAGVSDCYQPIEAKYKLMPEILKLMIKYKNPVSISTKSDLILRDYDLLDELSQVTNVSINASIVTMDDNLRRKIEPAGRNAKQKFAMLKEFSKTNASTGVLQMPIIPYLTDSRGNIENLYTHAREADVDYVVPGIMYLRGNTRNVFFDFIKDEFPDLFIPLTKLYQKGGRTEYKRALYQMINELRRRYQLSSYYAPKPFPIDDLAEIKKVATGFKQLSLFEETTSRTFTSAKISAGDRSISKAIPVTNEAAKQVNLNPFVEVEIGESAPIASAAKIQPFPPAPTIADPIRAKFYAMRQIARDLNVYNDHGKIFYAQAQFMADFEDDFSKVVTFSSYYPYYQQMNVDQLRTYFTWRKNIRNGDIRQVSTSYAFLYIYELLNQINVKNSEDGLNQLMSFWHGYRIFDEVLDSYVIKWLKDYHIYYDLPHSFADFVMKYDLIHHYPSVFCYDSDAEMSLDLFVNFSKYNVKKSIFYTSEHQPMIHDCFFFLLSELRTIFAKSGQCFEDLIFYPLDRLRTWIPFSRALFYPSGNHATRPTILSPRECYHYEEGRHRYTSTMLTDNGKQLVGFLIKEMESCLRTVTGFKYKLKVNPNMVVPQAKEKFQAVGIDFSDFVRLAVAEFYRQLNHQEVKVDLANLGRIRKEAYATQEKLIVPEDELVTVALPAPVVADSVKSEEVQQNPWSNLKNAFSTVELEALRLVISGGSLKDFARENLLMLEVMVEQINDKAMDFVGDALLEITDDAILFDDYMNDVLEMMEK